LLVPARTDFGEIAVRFDFWSDSRGDEQSPVSNNNTSIGQFDLFAQSSVCCDFPGAPSQTLLRDVKCNLKDDRPIAAS